MTALRSTRITRATSSAEAATVLLGELAALDVKAAVTPYHFGRLEAALAHMAQRVYELVDELEDRTP